jgi:transposase
MGYLNYKELVKEEIAQLRMLHRKQNKSLDRRRLQFLMLLKSGKCLTQRAAGALIGIGQRAAEKLWKLYATEGLDKLLEPPRSGRPSKLNEKARQDLQTQLDEHRVTTLRQACGFVAQQHGIILSQVAMHYYFKQEKIKKKTGRPTNIRKDVQGEEVFKKKLSPAETTLRSGYLLRR